MAAIPAEKSAMARLADDAAQVKSKVADVNAAVESELATEAGMGFLQVKNHALLNYTKMELFFALLKLEQPEKVKEHPVFKELVRYRTLLERVRPLDRKMKYQVDKMLKVALSGGKGMDESLDYAPNPDQLVGQDGAGGDDEDAEGSGDDEGRSKDGIYRAPRLASVPYEEDERATVKQAKKDERNRKRLQKSTILSELREEFSERPTEILASGTSVLDKEIAREEAEKKAYEESRFVRLVTSRKDKIRKRQREHEANRADHVTDIDNFAGVQDILAGDKGKRRIPTHIEIAKRIGGKTGGIFSHVEAPAEKKRKPSSRPPSSTSHQQQQRQQPRSAPAQQQASSSPAGPKKAGGKKKVVFSNIF